MRKEKSFLIINPFGIGDVLFSTPLIRNIKENFPRGRVFYLCNRRTFPILEAHPLIDKYFVYERDEFEGLRKKSLLAWIKKSLDFISEIKKENIDLALDLSLNPQFGFWSWAAGIKQRIGYNYKNRGRFLTKKIKFDGYNDKHIVEYYLDLLSFLGIPPSCKRIELFLAEVQKSDLALDEKFNLSGADSIVVIAPAGGMSWGKDSVRKHWPMSKFAALADKLMENLKVKVILSGSGQEKDIIDNIESLMVNSPIKAVDLPLPDFLRLISKARILISNDAGPVHMAVALNIKTVSIFGPVNELIYGPYPPDNTRHIIIKEDFSCRPCYRQFRLADCPYQKRCLEKIEVDKVYQAVRTLL